MADLRDFNDFNNYKLDMEINKSVISDETIIN